MSLMYIPPPIKKHTQLHFLLLKAPFIFEVEYHEQTIFQHFDTECTYQSCVNDITINIYVHHFTNDNRVG